jgi:acyl-CoA thioesterase-2
MPDHSEPFAELLRLMRLESLEVNLFRGESRDIGTDRVFGGQVLSQSVLAASATVEGRLIHSLHAYFLRAGDPLAPIVYNVDRSRDGRSFTARRVVAIQHGRPIFTMSASFRWPKWVEHQFRARSSGSGCRRQEPLLSEETLQHLPQKMQRWISRLARLNFAMCML